MSHVTSILNSIWQQAAVLPELLPVFGWRKYRPSFVLKMHPFLVLSFEVDGCVQFSGAEETVLSHICDMNV